MENQTLDIVAKLLANENINVVRAPVSTASFNTQSRTLVLPQWKEMTKVIDEMLVAHEIGHALFTTDVYYTALENRLKFKQAKAYLNVLEDVRIEKLTKRRYPGLRKVFHAGYRELNDLDFFGIQGKDLVAAHLMDRINIHFKVGYGVVDFNLAEMTFVNRAERTETEEDVIQLAQDIHDYIKAQEEAMAEQKAAAMAEMKAEMQEEEGEGDEYDEDEDFDGEIPEVDDEDTNHSFKQLTDEGESDDEAEQSDEDMDGEGEITDQDDSEGTMGASSEDGFETEVDTDEEVEQQFEDSDRGPETNRHFEERVAELADVNTEYRYYELAKFEYNPMVSYKEVASRIASYYTTPFSASTVERVRSFKRDTDNNVNYLVKEFEMRKAATAYKRAQTSKVGSLDMKKVWAYKLNDDIFKRVTSVKQGKNHGMVFLLDWSGSMNGVIDDTIDQVVNLALFCQRAGIAYQVFAFADTHETESHKAWRDQPRAELGNRKIDVNGYNLALIELFSNKMSQSEFNTALINLKSTRFRMMYPLSGTPLNQALAYMYEYIGEFQKKNNVEKTSFITLTDGQGSQMAYHSRVDYVTRDGVMSRVKVRNYLKDTESKKNHELDGDSSTETRVLLEMIKARYNCTVLGFYITRNNRRDLIDALRNHYSNNVAYWERIEQIKSDFRTHGFSTLKNTGRDELFLIPTTSTKVKYETLEVDSSANSRAIASKFGKYMSTKKTSRILLNKFIGLVA